MMSVDRSTVMANMMIAFKTGDQAKYLELLKRCESWMDSYYYSFFYNLGKSSAFARKGYYK